LNFDCRASRGRAENFSARVGREEKGVGGENEFPPRPRFFAAAIFRILLCKMRRQGMLPLSLPLIRGQRIYSLVFDSHKVLV